MCQSELSINLEKVLFVSDSLGNVYSLKEDLLRFLEFRKVKVGICQALHSLEDRVVVLPILNELDFQILLKVVDNLPVEVLGCFPTVIM